MTPPIPVPPWRDALSPPSPYPGDGGLHRGHGQLGEGRLEAVEQGLADGQHLHQRLWGHRGDGGDGAEQQDHGMAVHHLRARSCCRHQEFCMCALHHSGSQICTANRF